MKTNASATRILYRKRDMVVVGIMRKTKIIDRIYIGDAAVPEGQDGNLFTARCPLASKHCADTNVACKAHG